MEPHTQPAVAESAHEVPAGVRRARAAFLRDFDRLHADRTCRGKFVAYHLESLVAVDADHRRLLNKMYASCIPETEWLDLRVTPAARAEEQVFADEGDINPD